MRLRPVLIALPICAAAGLAQSPSDAAAPPPVLNWPIACQLGRDCFIQHYVDQDPGPGAKDYRCGVMTYDKHNGVDIRLPSLAASIIRPTM